MFLVVRKISFCKDNYLMMPFKFFNIENIRRVLPRLKCLCLRADKAQNILNLSIIVEIDKTYNFIELISMENTSHFG